MITPTCVAFFALFVVFTQWREYQLLWNKRLQIQPLAEEEVGYLVSQYLNPSDLSLRTDNLNPIAYKGQNMGGIDASKNSTSSSGSGPRQYVVMAGDTLSGIASKFDLHSGSLVLANQSLENTEILQIGQILTIPENDASAELLSQEYSNRVKKLASMQPSSAVTSSTSKRSTSMPSSRSAQLLRPVSYSYISQPFSARRHTGVDMVASIGTPVHAAQSGCIALASFGWNGGYGNMIKLNHGGGLSTLYGHLSDFANGIETGSCVEAGEIIAYVGSTGRSTGPHLHYEVRVNDVPQSPNQ